MKFLTSLVIFSIVVLHRADFGLNVEQNDDTTHAGGAKAPVIGSLPANQEQQQQQIHPSRTVSRTRIITYATLSPDGSQRKGRSKVVDPTGDITHQFGNTAQTSHRKERLGNVAASHKTLNQKDPANIKINSNAHDSVNSPVSDVDRKVFTNLDNGDQVEDPSLEDSEGSDRVQKFSHTSEAAVDHQTIPDAFELEAKWLNNEPKSNANELEKEKADAESVQQESNILSLELQVEQKITNEEVGEQRTPTLKQLLEEEKAIPKEHKLEQESTASQEDIQVEQMRSKETPQDDRMLDISSVDHLDHVRGSSVQPNTSDPVIPEASIEPLSPMQYADTSTSRGDGPMQPLGAMIDATEMSDSSEKQKQEPSVDKIPNKEDSSEPSVAMLNVTTFETSSNKSTTGTAKSDKENKSTKTADVQPSSVQPPSRLNELSPDVVPSTAFVPGEVKSESESKQKPLNELEVPNDMPSFDEWKQKEKEKSKHLEAEQTVQSTAPSVKVKGSKKRINYASVTCGAKIVGANQEAQNPSFILMENKDQYMINPCKVKKVFTAELCEPIQVQAIDIGNLELFSSLPQSFDVHVSDRFPSKEWKALGRFHARDERTIQTFQVEDSLIFAKYIKIETLSHYGQEHYCPLSILRVFGTTVDEDDDADDSESESPDELDEDNVTDSFAENKPTNLFASATDTVLSLVKTVLNPSIDTTEDDIGDPASLASIDGNLSSINSPGEGIKQMEPCTPEVNSGGANVVNDPATVVEGEAKQFQPSVPEAVVEASFQRQGDEENSSPFTITLIEVPRTPLQEILGTCEFCDDGKNETCFFDRDTTCGYYRVMSFFDPRSCVTAWHNLQMLQPRITVESSGVTGQLNMTSVPESEKTESKQQEDSRASMETVVSERKEDAVLGEEETLRTEKPPTSATLESTTVASKTDFQGNDAEKTGAGGDHSGTDKEPPIVTIPDGSIPASASKDYHSADKTSKSFSEAVSQEGEAAGDSRGHHETDGQVHGQDNQPGEGQTPQSQMASGQAIQTSSQEQLQSAHSQNKTPVQKPTNQSTGKPQSDKDDLSTGQGSNLRVIYAEASSKPDVTKDYELDGVLMDEITYQKLSSRGKESAFIKLKNRIKLLEGNLNLTNRYLEELSQRYKRQMEEMHSSLNKTIIKLSNMAKTAEERDVKQQDQIASLETTVENLTIVVGSVERSIESMQRQMIERHLYLMSLEVLIFSGILIFCLNRRSVQIVETDHRPKTLRSEPSPALSLPQSDGSAAVRRKSADSQPSSDQCLCLWNQQNKDIKFCNAVEEVKSHPPLSGAKTAANVISSAGANDFSKKRKKRKVSFIRSLSQAADMPEEFHCLPGHSPTTGLIFGTSFKDTLHRELVGQDELRSHCKRFSWDSSAYKPWKWNIFGSGQDEKSSVFSTVSCGTSSKPGRSEIRETNLSNELLDHRKNGLAKSLGFSENRQKEIRLFSVHDTHNKFHVKKVATRGCSVAD